MSKRDSRGTGAVARIAGSAGRGIGAATGAVGRVFGFLGGKRKPGRRAVERESWWARRKRKRDAGAGGALEDEIARLERELDRIYAEIVRGAGHVALDDHRGQATDLSTTMERARAIKRALRAKRAELARGKRMAERRSRLLKTAGQRAAEEPEPERTARTRRAPRAEERFAVSGKLRKAIARAERSAAFHDEAQRIAYEKTVHDMAEADPVVRRTAATHLGDLGSPAAIEVLCNALDDPDGRVRVAALNSLALIGDVSVEPIFQRFAASPDHHLRLAALRGLSRTGERDGDPVIIAGVDDEHPAIRRAAATFLGWRRDRTATKPLMRALRDEEEPVRAAAAAALGNIRDDRAVLSLIRALEDPALPVREAAKTALEAILGEELEMDLSVAVGAGNDERVDQLKDWWRSGRLEARTERARLPSFEGGPPKRAPRAEAPRAPEPAPAAEGLGADDGLAGLEALGVAPTDEVAAEAGGLDDGDGLVGLEALGVIGTDGGIGAAGDDGLDSGLDSGVEDLGLGGLDIRAAAAESGDDDREATRPAADKDADEAAKDDKDD